jgi:hypothetical protein
VEEGLSGRLFLEFSVTILAAIRREEKKVKKQLAKLLQDLSSLQSTAKALGKSAGGSSPLRRSICFQLPGEQGFQKKALMATQRRVSYGRR